MPAGKYYRGVSVERSFRHSEILGGNSLDLNKLVEIDLYIELFDEIPIRRFFKICRYRLRYQNVLYLQFAFCFFPNT